jgi:hypothetical protein
MVCIIGEIDMLTVGLDGVVLMLLRSEELCSSCGMHGYEDVEGASCFVAECTDDDDESRAEKRKAR